MKRFLFVIVTMLALGACAAAPAAPEATTSPVVAVQPVDSGPFLSLADGIDKLAQNNIFQLALKDATDTLAWIDTASDAPTDALSKAQAKVCPQMVQLAIADFQAKAKFWSDRLRSLDARVRSDTAQGPELILAMTKLRYSTSTLSNPQAELASIKQDVYNRVSAVLNGCRNILPTKQLVDVANIAVKAGIGTMLPGAAPLLLSQLPLP